MASVSPDHGPMPPDDMRVPPGKRDEVRKEDLLSKLPSAETKPPLTKTQATAMIQAIHKPHELIQAAVSELQKQTEGLSDKSLFDKLTTFNKKVAALNPDHGQKTGVEGIFDNIRSPDHTRLEGQGHAVHANWLADDRHFAAIMYPSETTRADMLSAMKESGITRHAYLANHFVVMLQNPTSAPFFPMNADTFKAMQGTRHITTEIGTLEVTFGDISAGSGLVTITGPAGEKREVMWPLDRLQLGPDLLIELTETGDRDTFVYMNNAGDIVHTLEVEKMQWIDFGGASITALHNLAMWLSQASTRSAGCRAGVGRTGTLFVATEMYIWKKEHPDKPLTRKEVLGFIAEGRLNRDPLVVQTMQQLATLIEYMHFLNSDPEMPLNDSIDSLLHRPEMQEKSKHRIGQELWNIMQSPALQRVLREPTGEFAAADEAALDRFFETFICPITQEPFVDPVVTPEGHTFERADLLQWMQLKRDSPITRTRLNADELKDDTFVQHLRSVMIKRESLLAPTTEAAKETVAKLEQLLVHEPLRWCRVVSSVMPKDRYFVRMKGLGNANDYVVEFRGITKVKKCGFSVDDKGLLVPKGHPELRFADVDQLVSWLAGKEGKKPSPLGKDELAALDRALGRDQFMASLFEDITLMKIVQHLELRLDDATVPNRYRNEGYVRAGISPASFPCFTYKYMVGHEIKARRFCLHNGSLCNVNLKTFKNINNEQELLAKIEQENMPQQDKQLYREEFEKIKKELTFPTSQVVLFLPTQEKIEPISLASIEEEVVRKAAEQGYSQVEM